MASQANAGQVLTPTDAAAAGVQEHPDRVTIPVDGAVPSGRANRHPSNGSGGSLATAIEATLPVGPAFAAARPAGVAGGVPRATAATPPATAAAASLPNCGSAGPTFVATGPAVGADGVTPPRRGAARSTANVPSSGLASAADAAAVAAEASLGVNLPGVTPLWSPGIRAAARAAAVAAHAVLSSPIHRKAPARSVAGSRRQRTPMSLGSKMNVIRWKEAGKSWDYIFQRLNKEYTHNALYKVYRGRAAVLARAATGASLDEVSTKSGAFPEVDARLAAWCTAVRARGRKRVPLSLAILRCKALQIATCLGVTNFSASNGFLQNWARRHGWSSVALHGCGASANVEEAAARMAEIRRELEGIDPDLIYNVDETGLLYRGLPARSYVPAEDHRRARGSKAMKSKDRVTLTLCCNATGTHKLPVTRIWKAMPPMCFIGEANRCPLPYFSQKSAWTDTKVFKRWFHDVFLPDIRTRTASHIFLIMDSLGCHSDISDPQVTIIELPPNTTAVYQPLDAGVIAALKRRYKLRLLQRVVTNLDRLLASGAPQPRVPRGGGLDEGGQAHLRDAAKIIEEEWRAVPAEHLAGCWLTANVLPTEAAAEVRRQILGVAPAFDNVHMDASGIVALMANASLAEEFAGVDAPGRVRAVHRWLAAESDVEAIDETVDMVLEGEDDGE